MTWDQGMGGAVPSLPGFRAHFNTNSGSSAKAIKDFVTTPYLGCIIGSTLSFFVNDLIGRKWFLRLSTAVYIIGQLMAIFAPNTDVLYGSRIVTGTGIGGFTVVGPMTLSEIALAETRGLVTSMYIIFMGVALFTAQLTVYGIYVQMSPSRFQYQVVFMIPILLMAVLIACSFFTCDSPTWLAIVGRRQDALTKNLAKLRGLPADHPRVQKDFKELESSLSQEKPKLLQIVKQTFTRKSNLRRVQQTLLSYAFAELSGANSLTSYFIPIVSLVTPGQSTRRHMFLNGMYGLFKFFSKLVAAFVFIDALGRRRSLFVGASIQMITHIYAAVFLNISASRDGGDISHAYAQSELAALFLHAFGYAVGLLTLPYVFGSELWPNHLRAFGAAFSGAFHWAFIYAVKYAVPDILASMGNWGAFVFFAGFCLLAIVYVYFVVPEISRLTGVEIEEVFSGPWFKAYRKARETRGREDVEDLKDEKAVEIEVHERSGRTLVARK